MKRRKYFSYILLLLGAVFVSLLNLSLGTWHSSAVPPTSNPLLVHPKVSPQPRGLQPSRPNKSTDEPPPTLQIYRNPHHPEQNPRPPLDSLVQEYNVTGDVSWLLNFAIVGFPKCGTSTLMLHLESHPEVQMFKDERCDVAFNKQARLVRDLYQEFPPGDYVRGTKCPMDLESTQLGIINYHKYFPKTDFIVGIRHPVLW